MGLLIVTVVLYGSGICVGWYIRGEYNKSKDGDSHA